MKSMGVSAVVGLALGGCLPMEQAPLVYTSKQQVGVTVAAGTADAPGLDVNIGYKGLDAAFVPVAVAKYCSTRRLNCKESNYDIKTIYGNNDISSQDAPSEGALALVSDTIKKLGKDRDAIEAERLTVARKVGLVDTLAADRELLVSKTTNPDGSKRTVPEEEQVQVAKLRKDVDEATQITAAEGYDRQALTSEQTNLATKSDTLSQQIIEAKTTQDRLIQERNLFSGNNRKDALSLYGSFDSDVAGKTEGASLTLGKVFATGVAAQRISEDVGAASLIRAKVACVETGLKTLGDTPEQAKLDKLRSNCGLDH